MITSLLDTDFYKLTQQQAVLQTYPNAIANYRFISRNPSPVNEKFMDELTTTIGKMRNIHLQTEEYSYLQEIPYLKIDYLTYLAFKFQFNPDRQIKINWDVPAGQRPNLQHLKLDISGPWHETILWEVPLMAIISECYFRTVDTNWNYNGQETRANQKGYRLAQAGCAFADFGTRRRRSFKAQQLIVEAFKNNLEIINATKTAGRGGFVGTSNVKLAMINNVKPIGTLAHEFFMAVSALESLRHANRCTLNIWNNVYQGNLGIALTDTFGTEAFFEDFDGVLSRLFDGVRHDSGDPFKFADRVVLHYKKHNINPLTKTIVFSDGLDIDLCLKLQEYCDKIGIRCSFGIGTHLTNHFDNSPALNMVIKLYSIAPDKNSEFIPVVKLSDVITKATGDKDAIRVARWIFNRTPLDAA